LGFHSSWLAALSEVANHHNIPCETLVEEVAAVDRENPSRELMEQIARDLSLNSRF